MKLSMTLTESEFSTLLRYADDCGFRKPRDIFEKRGVAIKAIKELIMHRSASYWSSDGADIMAEIGR